jgi:hypothetical protein
VPLTALSNERQREFVRETMCAPAPLRVVDGRCWHPLSPTNGFSGWIARIVTIPPERGERARWKSLLADCRGYAFDVTRANIPHGEDLRKALFSRM